MKHSFRILFSLLSLFIFSQENIKRNYFRDLYNKNPNIAYKKALDTLQSKNASHEIKFEANYFLYTYYFNNQNNKKLDIYLKQLNPKTELEYYNYFMINVYNSLYKNNPSEEIKYILKADSVFKHNNFHDSTYNLEKQYVRFYTKHEHYLKSLKIIDSTLAKIPNKQQYAIDKNRFFHYKSLVYLKLKEYEKALNYIDSAIHYTNYHKNIDYIYPSKLLKATIYVESEKYDEAKKIVLELNEPYYTENKLVKHSNLIKENKAILGKIYYKKRDYKKAKAILKEIVQNSFKKTYDSDFNFEYAEIYNDILYQNKDYEEAYTMLSLLDTIKDSISKTYKFNDFINKEIAHVEKIEKINYDYKQQKWYWIIIVAILLLIFVSILYIFRSNNMKTLQAKNNLIEEKNNELEKLNNSLEKFTQIVSHDLKAPIRTIGHLTTFIKEDEKATITDESKENLDYINLAVERSNNLIINLLALAKSNDDSIVMKKVEFSVILNAVKSNLFQLISDSNALILYKGTNTLIKGNESLLIQLFQNIIQNSIKYTRKEVNPIVEIFSFEDEKTLAFHIKDNGIGIKDEKKEKLFNSLSQEKFESLDKGIGLGLYITKKIADIHHANVSIQNNKNECGTTVVITFIV